MNTTGTVYLVGAGPGDPGLLTLKARDLIASCDVLVFDQLVNGQILSWAKPDCETIPMGKEPGITDANVQQEEIHRTLVARAREGKRVVRLKGGDPFVFGRGGEEMETLRAEGIPCEVVPGVTAAIGASTYSGIPLTHRDHSSHVTFLTGHEDPEKLTASFRFEDFSTTGGTLCIYMGMRKLGSIVERLLAGGMPEDTPAAVIQWATTSRHRILRSPIKDLPNRAEAEGLGSPAIIIIGKVAGQPESLDWFGRKPLLGRRVVVTRSRHQTGRFRGMLENLGAEVLELPMIEIRPKADPTVVSEIFAGLGSYEWIVFTSPNGVRHFFDIFHKAYPDIRAFGGMRVAAIGASTAQEVRQHRIDVELLPDEAVAESLAESLIATGSLPSANVLVVTGNQNRDVLPKMLEEQGEAIVDTLQVYETLETDLSNHPDAERYRREGADVITFTSSSTVHHFHRKKDQLNLEASARKPRTCSIGPITSKTLRSYGLAVDMESVVQSLEGMLEVLVDTLSEDDAG